MKTLFLTLTLFIGSSFALTLNEGSYKGKVRINKIRKEKIHFLIKKVEDRPGSFLGILLRNDLKKVRLYLIDPIDVSKYAMVPYEVNQYGEISILDDDPSLSIVLSGSDSKKFVITNSGSENETGFKETITFKSKRSRFKWVDHKSGEFHFYHRRNVLYISDENENFESQAILKLWGDHKGFDSSELSGEFEIRESWPNLYTLNQVKSVATGELVETMPSRVGVFLRKCNQVRLRRCKKIFLLVNPSNDTDVFKFWRRKK